MGAAAKFGAGLLHVNPRLPIDINTSITDSISPVRVEVRITSAFSLKDDQLYNHWLQSHDRVSCCNTLPIC